MDSISYTIHLMGLMLSISQSGYHTSLPHNQSTLNRCRLRALYAVLPYRCTCIYFQPLQTQEPYSISPPLLTRTDNNEFKSKPFSTASFKELNNMIKLA